MAIFTAGRYDVSTPQKLADSTPEVMTLVATATLQQTAEAPTEKAQVDQTSPVPSPFGERS
jgi:hypothetical protein